LSIALNKTNEYAHVRRLVEAGALFTLLATTSGEQPPNRKFSRKSEARANDVRPGASASHAEGGNGSGVAGNEYTP